MDCLEQLANIVPVPKKDGRVRICVDYRDLNKVYPKDDFPLPHIDVLIDNVVACAMYSFMDGFFGYNQILMAIINKVKTSFITEWGTYYYRVMPFGLKNTGATYQRMAMKRVELYNPSLQDLVQSKQGIEQSRIFGQLYIH